MPQGLRAIHSGGFMYGLKPVATLRLGVRVKQAIPFRQKEVPQGLKPSLKPVRCGTAKAVPFVQRRFFRSVFKPWNTLFISFQPKSHLFPQPVEPPACEPRVNKP